MRSAKSLAACFGALVFCSRLSHTMAAQTGERTFARMLTAHQLREGGGFLVRRSVGSRDRSVLDPFLMLDHLGPVEYGPGEAVGAPDHPHRGFETVTYVLEGGWHHKDSQGNEGHLHKGWVQWMTAGSGVIHTEMPSDELLEKGGLNEGFQLWVNLPKAHKMAKPRYQDVPPENIPRAKSADGLVEAVVIAGECMGVSAVIDTYIPITMLDIRLKPGGKHTQFIPADQNAFVYVYRGRGQLGKEAAKLGDWVVLENDGDQFTISCPPDAKEIGVLLLAGQPINEPVARYGPFVMNTQDEIQQAFRDYQSGVFGQIQGEEERMEKTRKARQAGGIKRDEF